MRVVVVLGLMLIPERERAMIGIRRALKSGGKLAALVFSLPERNTLVSSPIAIARRHVGLPATVDEDPGRFALADPEALRAVFEQAGFRDVAVQVEPIERRFPSVAEAVQHPLDAIPDIAKLMADLGAGGRAAIRAEIAAVMQQFDGPDGIVAPGEHLIGVGTK